MPMSFANRVFFDWRIIPHTTVSKHTQIYDVHCCNKYTSNMVAVIVVNRMS